MNLKPLLLLALAPLAWSSASLNGGVHGPGPIQSAYPLNHESVETSLSSFNVFGRRLEKNKDGTYETSLTVKESIKIPNKMEATAAFQGLLFSENGNSKITGQHGLIPLILSQSEDEIIQACKQIIVKKINKFLLFCAIIFQDLNPIYSLR